MADALAGLMDDPARARAMAASGYDRIAANYSFTAMVQRIQAIYDEVLHAPRASETQREAAA
jgi:glycosyltransferase involved in cell wall biosynthesis